MLIIEIAALDNGAHRNQTCHGIVPEGWAIIPDEMELPDTFPFVDIEVEGVFVVSMTAREIPEPEPEPEQPREPTTSELLDIMLGVNADE